MKAVPKNKGFIIAFVSVVSTLVWFTQVPAYAQVSYASLSGTITDVSEAVIADARISIMNVATGVVTIVETNSHGFFAAPTLLPGTYEVTVSAPGFSSAVQKDVVLTVGGQQVLNVTMKVGAMSAKVEVTAEVPLVQLGSAAIGDVVNSTTIVDLPLNGRSWTDLALLQPGVTGVHSQAPTTGPDRGQRGLGSQITVSGNRPQQNTYLLDGINVQDYSNGGPGSVTGGSIGVDSIQEFTVFTGSYSAQYGRTSGGVINAITRSGTNQFHGDGYEFIRNSALDAKTFFDTKKPPFRRNQFGAAVGGPIRKDKTFIFGNYEGLRESLGLTQVDIVPSQAARKGNICAPPDCSTTIPVQVESRVSSYLTAFYPLPNGAILCPFPSCVPGAGDTGNYSFAGSQTTTENYFTARVDNHFSEKDSLFATYFFDNAYLKRPDEFNNKFVQDKTRRQLVAISENHIVSPLVVNSARIGYNRVFASAPGGAIAINANTADPAFGFVPGDTAGEIHVTGLTTFSGGLSPATPLLWRWNSWQAYDDVFVTKGIHFFKFGANVERIEDNLFGTPHPGGRFFFGSLQSFLADSGPIKFSTDLPGGISPRGIRQTVFGAYVEDDIRVRRNLTINLGIRYEMATVPNEVNNKLSSLLNIADRAPHVGAPLFSNPTLHNFEPRVGFSWDPFRDGKTAVRAAFGIFDVLPLPIELAAAITNSAPFYTSGSASNLGDGSFPIQAFSSVANSPNTSRLTYVEQHPHRNYVMQWNLNVQRQLTSTLSLMTAYVGSRGIHNVFQADDANIVLPTLTAQGYFWPNPSGSGTLLNPNVGRLPVTLWRSDSYYHALQLQLAKRLSRGLRGQVAYTWARNIDTSSGSGYSDPYTNSITSLFFFSEKLRRGLSDLNVSHSLVANYIWRIPTPESFRGVAKWALDGWQWGGILTINSGTPFTPQIGADPLGLNSNDPFAYPDRLSGPGCRSLVNPGNVANYIKLQCFGLPMAPVGFGSLCQPFPAAPGPGTCENRLGNAGRNSIVGPGLMTLDMSLFKDHLIPTGKFSDRLNVQFRAEAFNILNHPNFASPINNSVLFNPDGTPVGGAGQIDTLTTTARQIQFGIKLIW